MPQNPGETVDSSRFRACVCHSMQWAFVRITRRLASITKPEPLERCCRRRCQGKEKFGVLWTHHTWAVLRPLFLHGHGCS